MCNKSFLAVIMFYKNKVSYRKTLSNVIIYLHVETHYRKMLDIFDKKTYK